MREIIFRGKRLDNREWYYGSYLFLHISSVDWTGAKMGKPEDVHYIVNDQDINYAVSPSTVGQYTGLKDKNGKRIFEGDILLLDDIKGIVNYGTGCFCVKLSDPDYLYRNNPAIDIVLNEYPGVEIIGNIHDNPELLEGNKER